MKGYQGPAKIEAEEALQQSVCSQLRPAVVAFSNRKLLVDLRALWTNESAHV